MKKKGEMEMITYPLQFERSYHKLGNDNWVGFHQSGRERGRYLPNDWTLDILQMIFAILSPMYAIDPLHIIAVE